MTEQTLYRIELRGHEHEQKKSDHFYKPAEEVIAQLESIRNISRVTSITSISTQPNHLIRRYWPSPGCTSVACR